MVVVGLESGFYRGQVMVVVGLESGFYRGQVMVVVGLESGFYRGSWSSWDWRVVSIGGHGRRGTGEWFL